ncbi:MAG TPA: RNA pyrophosphohydrolase [Rhizobiaceae bacterium]|nr:RNA pyrophosphohydrolase [Rhizobiaceae bacterium]
MRSGHPDDSSSHIHHLLNDPMIQRVMDADKVDTSALLAILVRTAHRLKEQYSDLTAGAQVLAERVTPFDTKFRPGVGVMLVNGFGQVFVGKRVNMIEEAWQMPQGGIDGDETPIIAAMRELLEELGTANVEVVAESSRWLQYELPSSLQGRAWGGQWRGQRQKWFLMRFLGDDREINIATDHPEFSAWRWVPPEHLVELIVAFKRRLYLDIVEEFADFLSRGQQKGGDRR